MVYSHTVRVVEDVEYVLMLCYGIVLVAFYLIASASHDVWTSMRARTAEEEGPAPSLGPGGRPLPASKKKVLRILESTTTVNDISYSTRLIFEWSIVLTVLCFVADGINVAVHALSDIDDAIKGPERFGWWCGEEMSVYITTGVAVHVYPLVRMLSGSPTPVVVNFAFWSLSLLLDLIIITCDGLRVTGDHMVLRNVTKDKWVKVTGPNEWDRVQLIIFATRIILVTFMCSLSGVIAFTRKQPADEKPEPRPARAAAGSGDTSETTPLLNGHRTTPNGRESHASSRDINPASGRTSQVSQRRRAQSQSAGTGTGTTNTNASPAQGLYRDEEAGFYRPEKLPYKTWWDYVRGYKVFFPYVWPHRERWLQFLCFVCFVLMILQRLANVMVPYQIGIVTEALSYADGVMPWKEMFALIFYKTMQGPSGVLGSARSILWIPVSQFCYRSLTTAAFEHVHSLSLDFHLGKRTGEVLSALNKGASINNFLEQVTFQVFPMLIDLIVAIVCFLLWFGAAQAAIGGDVTFYYLHMTVMMAGSRTDQRREMVNADREEEAVKNDSITSYETVKYFNAEAYEFQRYRNAIETFQVAEANVTWGLSNMNMAQTLVFMSGMFVILMIGSFQVAMGLFRVSHFVSLITYLGQLQGPLNFFGTFYRTVQQAMVSGERLLELFKIRPSVVDKPGVMALETCTGRISWQNVQFNYGKDKPALHGISFDCVPGTTTAFVGESGGGKSTIFRLMFRYYNCQEGKIEVDGHDVKDLTIDSVRRHIGVVPQDTIMFNESIMYNLRYANQDATDEEIYDACRAASIHDRIMTFQDKYNTKVGERGLRLSGGEKQRVAIARTILKRPKIIMLDEATSALDSETEQKIQSELIRGSNLGQDRTLLIIAHRLSTITHADQILVLHAGTIVERGRHHELLALNGRYASMWEKQSQAEQAAIEARNATKVANDLLRQAHLPSPKHADASDGYHSMSSSAMLSLSDTGVAEGASTRSSDDSASSTSDEDSTLTAKPATKETTKDSTGIA